MKLTPWFPPEIRPKHNGVYEVADFGSFATDMGQKVYAYWNGSRFGWRHGWSGTKQSDIDGAFLDRDQITDLPALTNWRGLARKPE